MRLRRRAFCTGLATALSLAAMENARALPPPDEPRVTPTTTPTAAPSGSTLPYGSNLDFVLDDKVNSGTTSPGTIVHMHLQTALVVNGATIAAAGTPAQFEIINARKAHSGDEDGALQIHLDPLVLPGRDMNLPIRAYHEFLTVEHSTGQLTTLEASDTAADIFIPGHYLYHAFRSGRQMVLPVGSVLRAQTSATIDASNVNRIVLASPPPFVTHNDTPHADLTLAPFYTPAPERPRPLPKGKATIPPAPTASPVPSEAPAASATPAATNTPVASAKPT